jgi:hypothetical protein
MKILALDLAKFKSVSCLWDTETNEKELWTLSTNQRYLGALLDKSQRDLVVPLRNAR